MSLINIRHSENLKEFLFVIG
jgi:hypothetical protein